MSRLYAQISSFYIKNLSILALWSPWESQSQPLRITRKEGHIDKLVYFFRDKLYFIFM